MSNEIQVERLISLRTAFFYSLSENPEEDAWNDALFWLKNKNFLNDYSKVRVFGRNIYPTENPEPHGYAYYITITPDIQIETNMKVYILPGGLYATLQCEGFEGLGKTWPIIWKWVEESNYKYIGETKSELGFELGLEEHSNWYEFLIEKSQNQIVFNLMIQLYEK